MLKLITEKIRKIIKNHVSPKSKIIEIHLKNKYVWWFRRLHVRMVKVSKNIKNASKNPSKIYGNRCNLRPQKGNENNMEKGSKKGANMIYHRKSAEKEPIFKIRRPPLASDFFIPPYSLRSWKATIMKRSAALRKLRSASRHPPTHRDERIDHLPYLPTYLPTSFLPSFFTSSLTFYLATPFLAFFFTCFLPNLLPQGGG